MYSQSVIVLFETKKSDTQSIQVFLREFVQWSGMKMTNKRPGRCETIDQTPPNTILPS